MTFDDFPAWILGAFCLSGFVSFLYSIWMVRFYPRKNDIVTLVHTPIDDIKLFARMVAAVDLHHSFTQRAGFFTDKIVCDTCGEKFGVGIIPTQTRSHWVAVKHIEKMERVFK